MGGGGVGRKGGSRECWIYAGALCRRAKSSPVDEGSWRRRRQLPGDSNSEIEREPAGSKRRATASEASPVLSAFELVPKKNVFPHMKNKKRTNHGRGRSWGSRSLFCLRRLRNRKRNGMSMQRVVFRLSARTAHRQQRRRQRSSRAFSFHSNFSAAVRLVKGCERPTDEIDTLHDGGGKKIAGRPAAGRKIRKTLDNEVFTGHDDSGKPGAQKKL